MIRASAGTALVIVLLLLQGLPLRGASATLDEATRLAALGRVWGFLKYYNPRVAEGQVDWDTSLLRAIPRVKRAQTKADLNHELLRLVRSVDTRVRVPADAALSAPETIPALRWLDDTSVLDPVTTYILKTYRYSTLTGANRYVKPLSAVGNPDFSGEAPFTSPSYPSEEYRLLALFRYWNMVQYYFPYRDVIDRPWDEVLEAFVPKVAGAADATAYHLALAELTSSINDSHGVAGSTELTNFFGVNTAPIRARYIESQTVVTKVLSRFTAGADIRPGDVVTDIDGVASAARRAELAKYVAGSNPSSLHRNLSSIILRTSKPTTRLGLSRNGVRHEVELTTRPIAEVSAEDLATEDTTVWRLLRDNIGYVHMGWLQPADVPSVMDQLRNTRAIVFDVRNYPNGTFHLIAQRLNSEPREFAIFTEPVYQAPGTLRWRTGAVRVGPATPTTPFYRGKVILLADERSQSHAEFTLMALKTAPDVTLVGSQTSGADGNVSTIELPGGFGTRFSGIGVFYPDRTPTQRIGIVPDHEIRPTIAGIRAGEDEVLAYALGLVPRQ